MVMLNGHQFLIGADPEVFIKKKDSAEHVSAFGVAPGTKTNPFRVNNGFIQVDGMALEYNVAPSANKTEFVQNVISVQKQLAAYLPKGCEFSKSPVARFGKEYIDSQPFEAKELGCDPDFNAYTGEPNETPNCNADFRTASGHIHIGWTENVDPTDPGHFAACRELVISLDRMIGINQASWDRDNTRRELYGKAGAFRPKHYGVEYRTPSNKWTFHRSLMMFVFDMTVQAIANTFVRYYLPEGAIEREVRKAIDKGNRVPLGAIYRDIYNIPQYVAEGRW